MLQYVNCDVLSVTGEELENVELCYKRAALSTTTDRKMVVPAIEYAPVGKLQAAVIKVLPGRLTFWFRVNGFSVGPTYSVNVPDTGEQRTWYLSELFDHREDRYIKDNYGVWSWVKSSSVASSGGGSGASGGSSSGGSSSGGSSTGGTVSGGDIAAGSITWEKLNTDLQAQLIRCLNPEIEDGSITEAKLSQGLKDKITAAENSTGAGGSSSSGGPIIPADGSITEAKFEPTFYQKVKTYGEQAAQLHDFLVNYIDLVGEGSERYHIWDRAVFGHVLCGAGETTGKIPYKPNSVFSTIALSPKINEQQATLKYEQSGDGWIYRLNPAGFYTEGQPVWLFYNADEEDMTGKRPWIEGEAAPAGFTLQKSTSPYAF